MKRLDVRANTLPLGIDIGTTRVRIALARRRPDGTPELIAVATRERGTDLGSVLADALAELRTRERRCVFGVGEPSATLRAATFPAMRPWERERAARYEASRFIEYALEEAVVRAVNLDSTGNEIAIGVVRKAVVAELKAAAQKAKLHILAIDNNAYALHRAIPDADAVLDIGCGGSVLHVYGGRVPMAFRLRVGGSAFTQAIVDTLGTDELTAERRKHAHGIAGSAEAVRDSLIESVAHALVECRAGAYGDVRSVALVGNGARLTGLAPLIERATAVHVRLAALAPSVSQTLPPDVLRAAAPDWCQAYGLSLWPAA